MKDILPGNRAQGAVALLLLTIALIAGTALFANAVVDTKWVEVEARTTELDLLRRRMQMPTPVKTVSDDEQNVYLEGVNYTLAANALQQRVVELIDESGGKLVTVGVEPANSAEQGVSRRVVLQIVAELDNDGLQSLLYQLETVRPLVMIESLTVRRAPQRGEAENVAQESPRLATDLRMVGYYRLAGP